MKWFSLLGSFFIFATSLAFANETGSKEAEKAYPVVPPTVTPNPEIEAVLKRPPLEVQRPNLKSQWTKMREAVDKDFYINIGEVFRIKNILEFPTLFNYKNSSSSHGSETATVKIDCLNNLWTVSDLVAWTKPMGNGQTLTINNKQLEWSALDFRNSDDVFVTLHRDFCKIHILGVRPQLTNGRQWAPMSGSSYAEQITRLFKSHITLTSAVTPESYVEVVISIDAEGVVSDVKTVSRSGDPLWEEAVTNSIRTIATRYQIRSPNGYGNSGKMQIRFKP